MPKKTIYFDSYCGYSFAAISENGKVSDFGYEKTKKGCAVGNVYKGVVENVLEGMQAAFVNCNLERNCFLSDEGMPTDCEKYDGTAILSTVPDAHAQTASSPALPHVAEGGEILVQVTKLPVGNKGAKVTSRLSFVGNYLIYLPDSEFIGVSRKIDDEELRRNLAYTAKRIKDDGEGLVVRTAAAYADAESVRNEYQYLKKLYTDILEKSKTAKAGALLYNDDSLPVRILRDVLSRDVDKIIVGNAELKKTVEALMSLYPADTRKPVILHGSGRDMADELGISGQIFSIASPKVPLENGGYIVIERTEALTVVDVNTGRFTGDYNLEQTVYHTNLLAAREIARQVKLRNIGGIVVVDFIDMENETHSRAIAEELTRLLQRDKAKCSVAPMSKFGLVEFTRKRIGANPLNLMVKPCKNCKKTGYTMTDEFILINLRAKILNAVADGAKALRIDMNADILNKLLTLPEFLSDFKTRTAGVKIYAVPHKTYREEQFNIRADDFEHSDKSVKIN